MSKKAKITIIGINFYPEDTSTGLYTTKMAEFLQENGFNVSVMGEAEGSGIENRN